ncbi:transcriptional regulator [Indibacter alkaliphilus LW1]|jgi:DNA-binding NarL/FixJ family response regulator|uniref:Transcriptional regulator n=1 Tax=Indibacter alkaliphilus (strain CCUG 57479 / KCTC 22604 / LW1) TaxID=1189612 RepID=S2E623_INDAL|nr:response regulator transcription factor [Indibacter alkaliphilus]EPA00062.1 transcriptional regulator [Indibacter alkaliphilus LW1]
MNEVLVIADDHPLLLKGLKDFLEENDFLVAAAAKNGREAWEAINELKPGIAILDLEMPGMTGLEIAKACGRDNIPTKIILFTLHKELFIFQQADSLNISGYLLKDFATEEIINCLEEVKQGRKYFSEKLFKSKEEKQNVSQGASLTPSEKKILRLIADGLTTPAIADKLFVAERTVEKHRSNIISKLKLDKKHNALLVWAQKNKGIIF